MGRGREGEGIGRRRKGNNTAGRNPTNLRRDCRGGRRVKLGESKRWPLMLMHRPSRTKRRATGIPARSILPLPPSFPVSFFHRAGASLPSMPNLRANTRCLLKVLIARQCESGTNGDRREGRGRGEGRDGRRRRSVCVCSIAESRLCR